TDHRNSVPTSAQLDHAVGVGRVRTAQARHLAGAGGRGEPGPRRDGTMKDWSNKSIERMLYLVSPIGLLVIWQLLLMAGFGDRRFIPAPTDIGARFVILAGNGELEWHTAVTLWRVFAGFLIGAVPAVAIGLLMA